MTDKNPQTPKKENKLEKVVAWAKRKGFVYPGSDIYGGLANSRHYGPYGAQLRKNIIDARWKFFVTKQPNIYGIEGSILMHPKVREASGHVDTFNDPLVDDKSTGERFRADKLIEEDIAAKLEKGDSDTLMADLTAKIGVETFNAGSRTLDQQKAYLTTYAIKNPTTKKPADRTNVRKFSLMLSTQLGVIEDSSAKVWMRPETAQTMFIDFRNVVDTVRVQLPFGIAQVGKVFRNEITPGNFLFRTREFEQMEIQMFLRAEDSTKWFDKFFELSRDFWTNKIGIKKDHLRLREHDKDELAHYAARARDFEYQFPRGWGELQGIHDRGNFDLTQHQTHSGKDLQYTDPHTGERFIPNVVELSMGLSRTIATALIDAYEEEVLTNSNGEEDIRVVLKIHKKLAPVTCAILPLLKKEENQVAMAKSIFDTLSDTYNCEYDESGTVGKRYRRQDEIGTPFCITVDHQSIEDNTVTVRDRDTMAQVRIAIADLGNYLLTA